ncbi:MAG TPA: phosphoribosylglycinamide formyltransferase [Pseudomonadales bacterium]|nr:phosphoribosylglycinamide formyltransferase [Pseudomonadales bacterium]
MSEAAAESLRIVVLLSGRGSNLAALIDAVHGPAQMPASIVGVVSNRPDAGGLAHARAAGITTACVDHRACADRATFERMLATAIEALAPDLLVLAGFMRILSAEFVERFSPRMLNVHPSLLPDFPGLDTHARALARGDAQAGASVHVVIPELDAGPVLARVRVPVLPGDDPARLAGRVLAAEHLLYPEVIGWIATGRLRLDGPWPHLDGAPVPRLGIDLEVDHETEAEADSAADPGRPGGRLKPCASNGS